MSTWGSSSHPISDIRDWKQSGRLELRPSFQRREVWSSAAKMLLMDTIIANVPMPKIYVHAKIQKKQTYRIVIDGQQRLTAIFGFLDDEYKLGKPYEGPYKGKLFSELPPEVQTRFLEYKIDINGISNVRKRPKNC